MSVTGPSPQDSEHGLIHTAIDHTCFYCGTMLRDPAIHWMGATDEIFLHPGCCVDLTIRLFRDVHQWQHQDGGYFGETK
jgi:hypothetical protein